MNMNRTGVLFPYHEPDKSFLASDSPTCLPLSTNLVAIFCPRRRVRPSFTRVCTSCIPAPSRLSPPGVGASANGRTKTHPTPITTRVLHHCSLSPSTVARFARASSSPSLRRCISFAHAPLSSAARLRRVRERLDADSDLISSPSLLRPHPPSTAALRRPPSLLRPGAPHWCDSMTKSQRTKSQKTKSQKTISQKTKSQMDKSQEDKSQIS